MIEPPAKPGIALYFSTQPTKKDTYAKVLEMNSPTPSLAVSGSQDMHSLAQFSLLAEWIWESLPTAIHTYGASQVCTYHGAPGVSMCLVPI